MINHDIADTTMDGCRESRRNSNDQQSSGTSGSISCPTTASINQEEQSKSRKGIDRKKSEEEELVKYMSKLPSYLERGKNLQEKVLNVGVLDWGRLEKWQHRHKQMPYRSSRNSPSSSNTTSCFSTDESSTHSSRGHSCSPAQPRVHRPSLESHFIKSPIEGHSEVVNSFRETVETFKDLKAGGSSTLNGLENFIGTDKSLCKNHPDIKVEQYMRKDSDPKSEPKKGVLRSGPHETAAHGELMKKSENLDKSYSESSEPEREHAHSGQSLPHHFCHGQTQQGCHGTSEASRAIPSPSHVRPRCAHRLHQRQKQEVQPETREVLRQVHRGYSGRFGAWNCRLKEAIFVWALHNSILFHFPTNTI